MNFSRTHLSIPSSRAPWVKAEDNSHIRTAIVISIILHLLFLSYLATQHFQEFPTVMEIELTSLPEVSTRKAVQEQIVAPPEQKQESQEPQKPSFRSEVDSQTAIEQIKRGDGLDAGIPNPESKNPEQDFSEKQEKSHKVEETQQKKEIQKEIPVEEKPPGGRASSRADRAIKESKVTTPLKQLALDQNTLLEKFTKDEEKNEQAQTVARLSSPQQYRAFSRPPGSGARFIGQRGSNDYLPNLPDGDITLLNTKADQFAVFVRRVATQVFSEIRNTGWEVLSATDINGASQYSTFRAVLSLKGELLRVEPITASGSTRFDDAIGQAVKRGARDQNPPAAAVAPDGNIHFIFQAKSWSQRVANGRTGAPMERRWLLLATGLE